MWVQNALLFPFTYKVTKVKLNKELKKKQSKADGLPVPMGVCAKWVKIGEIVGEMWPAGDDLSGTRGLLMLPRLQSLMRPCWIGLDEN